MKSFMEAMGILASKKMYMFQRHRGKEMELELKKGFFVR